LIEKRSGAPVAALVGFAHRTGAKFVLAEIVMLALVGFAHRIGASIGSVARIGPVTR